MSDIKTVIETGPVVHSQFNNGIQGPQGAPFVNYIGAYNPLTAYAVYDGVTYLGSSYMCILSALGKVPTNATYWVLIASKGDTGETGATYTLPTATDSILGGVKVGTRLSILGGVLSADATDISGKVDKETGKSLVADTLITDLSDGGDTTAHTHALSNGTGDMKVARTLNVGTNVTATVLSLQVNNIEKIMINASGITLKDNIYIFPAKSLNNDNSGNNSKYEFLDAGSKISRNIADANPALIVNQVHASSTGNILDLQFGGVQKAYINKFGAIFATQVASKFGIINDAAENNAYVNTSTTGTQISRNVADANSALRVNLAHASSTGLITDFQFGGVSKASIDRFGTVASPKSAINADGGIMVKLTNKTGANSVKGHVVRANPDVDSSVVKTTDGIPDAIGVFYESGIADGAEAWVVVSGIAEVYFVGDVARSQLARTFVASEVGYVIGQAIAETVPSAPFATDKHFCEIGHCISARTGAGLAKVVLHMN